MGSIEGLAQRVVEYDSKLGGEESGSDEVIVSARLWRDLVRGARLELDVGQLGSQAQRTIAEPTWPTHPGPAFAPVLEQKLQKLGVFKATADQPLKRKAKRPVRPLLTAKSYDLGIIACSASKAPGAGLKMARELYTGQLFKLALAASEKLCGETVILSGKHHVLRPEELLFTYDQKIPTGGPGTQPVLDWTDRAAEILHKRYLDGHKEPRRILVLAGENYFRLIKVALVNHRVEQPLKGIGIGRQKSVLKKMLAEAAAEVAA